MIVTFDRQKRNRLAPLGLQAAERERPFQEGAPVEQAGQAVGAGGAAVDVDVMVLDHQQHDEGGADGVDHDLEREHREPGLRQHARQQGAHGERQQEDAGVQRGHHDRGGARIKRLAPLAAELVGDAERVARDHQRAEHDAGSAGFRQTAAAAAR